MKKILLAMRNILILTLVTLSMLMLMWMNVQFSCISLMRHDAIDMSFYNHAAAEKLYDEAITEMENFSNEGDYQEWLVSSGSTYTGKFVRVIVMLTELVIFFYSIKLIYENVRYLFRRVKRMFKRAKQLKRK